MDAFTWFKIINRAEFLATGLVSRELAIVLEGVGAKTVLVTVGNFFSITIDDVMLCLGLTSDNPFLFGDRAIVVDLNDDVFYGIPK